MEYYSAKKRNKVLIHTAIWMKLRNITKDPNRLYTKGKILYSSIYMNYLEKAMS